MPFAFRRILERNDKVQQATVPKDAKPVMFMNRAGEPTVYFSTSTADKAKGPQRIARLVLTSGEAKAPDGAAYIGSAEFSGGQVFYHAWEAPNA